MTIVYRSKIFQPITGNDCSDAPEPNRRKTSFVFSCNPNIPKLNVTAPGLEIQRCTYEVQIDTSLVCRDCPLNCSQPHGTCNRVTGECECDSQTNGKGCELSRIYINSVDSTTINGGTTYLHGYFGIYNTTTTTTSQRLSIKIGELQCKNIQVINDSTIQCDIGPGEGIKDVTIIDMDISYTGKQIFQYTKIKHSCPNDCTSSSNGICNTDLGICTCINGFTGFNCNSQDSNPDAPSSKPNINETTGEASISNDGSNYQISIYSLVELNFNGSTVNEFLLSNKWNKTNNNNNTNNDNNRIVVFSQFISNASCTIEYSIEEVIGKNKNYSFAGVNFTLSPGSLKLTVSIQNYTYHSTLNSIQLRIKSSLGDYNNSNNNSNGNKNCNAKKLDINTNDFKNDQSLNYLTISKDSKTFYGRFINKVISDGRETFMSTSIVGQRTDSILIGLNLPHCKTCLIDPDFSLLVDQDYKTSCDDDDSRPKWFLPVVIVAPAVGAAIIIIIGSIIYKRHRVGIRILKQKIKLENRQQ